MTTEQGDLILDRTEKYVDNFVRISAVDLSLNFHLVFRGGENQVTKVPQFFSKKNQFQFQSFSGHFLDCISSSN